jgi:mRNA interferase MazF
METTFQPGDVVLVRFPFTDLTTTKVRPAVVLATHRLDLTIVGIFSGPQPPTQLSWIVLLDQDPAFPQTGLKATSTIKPERIAVIERSAVIRKLGALSPYQMDQVKSAVRRVLNLE